MLRIANSFSDSLTRLTKAEQNAIKLTAFDLQAAGPTPGMKWEKLRFKDKGFRSARVSDDLRIIIHESEGDRLLCFAGHHDEAYAWAQRRRLETHPKTGAAQFVEVRETVEEIRMQRYVEELRPSPEERPLFEHLTNDELLSYGVPPLWLADVRASTKSTLLELTDHLPYEAAEALFDIAVGGRPQVSQPVPPGGDPFEHPAARQRFHAVLGPEDVDRELDRVAAITKRTKCWSKDEFVDLMQLWLEASQEQQIGLADRGQTKWVDIELSNGVKLYLNADSKRSGIAKFVAHHRAGHLAWHVSPAQRSKRFTVVSNSPDGEKIPGVHLYLNKATAGPAVI